MQSEPSSGEGTALGSDPVIAEIRKQATSGALMVTVRGFIVRLFALLGGVALARMLQPRDFGVVAFGAAFYSFIAFASDAGLGAGLIRKETMPSRAELGGVVAVQLAVTSIVSGVTIAIAWPHGIIGHVTALMVVAVPFTAFRTPGTIALERKLHYRPLVFVEMAEVFSYYAWAVATVWAGWGVWGLASATVARIVVGTALMVLISPVGVVLPRPSWTQIRGLLAFGLKFQAVSIMNLIRDQGLNFGTAIIAGTSVLGLWSLSSTILRVSFLMFESLWRVTFPVMARMHRSGLEARGVIERMVALSALGAGCVLVPLVGAGPHWVGLLFGSAWSGSYAVIPWASVGLMIAGPISAASAGYLYAVGDAGRVLRGVVLHTIAWGAVSFLLLPSRGIEALGIGWLAASLVEAAVLGHGTVARSGAKLVRPLAVQLGAAIGAALCGWLVAVVFASANIGPLVGALLAEAVYLGLIRVVKHDLVASAANMLKLAFTRPASSVAPASSSTMS